MELGIVDGYNEGVKQAGTISAPVNVPSSELKVMSLSILSVVLLLVLILNDNSPDHKGFCASKMTVLSVILVNELNNAKFVSCVLEGVHSVFVVSISRYMLLRRYQTSKEGHSPSLTQLRVYGEDCECVWNTSSFTQYSRDRYRYL